MDVHMQSKSQLQFRTNEATGRNPKRSDDELKFLSQEEKDTLQYFEQTIDSLEQSLEEDELRPQVKACNDAAHITDGSSIRGPKEQIHDNIIDLVRPKPDLVQTKETPITCTSPDFQRLISSPGSHFEIKPHSNPADTLPSEYNLPLADSHPTYHPPGSIPTPVLIAHRIAENQAGGSSSLTAAAILRRRSSEFEKSTNTTNVSNKYGGPPTFAKPSRYPPNINVILGSREQHNQSLANIKIEERRAQMLENLSGTSHPLLQEDAQDNSVDKGRNTPTRSVSFRDPTPEKSRLEALSKLGLTRNRAMSGNVSLPSTNLEPLIGAETSTQNMKQSRLPECTSANNLEPITPPNIISRRLKEPSSPPHLFASSKPQQITTLLEPSGAPNVVLGTKPHESSGPSIVPTSSKLPVKSLTSPVQSYVGKRPEIPQTEIHRGLDNRYSPPPDFASNDIPPSPPVDASAEFNRYGGKSIVVHPSASLKSEPPTSPVSPDPKGLSPLLDNPSQFNPYGGKSKVVAPVPMAVTRKDLPDILSSHINRNQMLHTTSEHNSTEINSYGGKSRTFNPTASSGRPLEGVSGALKPPAPTPAPRPPRHSYHGPVGAQKSPQQALSPEQRHRTGSLFRPQGITVQFSSKGATDESRREALRKLGLLKD